MDAAAPQGNPPPLSNRQESVTFEHKQSLLLKALQMMVYPTIIVFIILAFYGFFLVRSLIADVHHLTLTITKMQESVDSSMKNIANSMDHMALKINNVAASTQQMTKQITSMSVDTQNMAEQMAAMRLNTQTMTEQMEFMGFDTQQMSQYMANMNASTQNMAASMYNVQSDMGNLNNNFSSPMKMMRNVMPFGGRKNRRVAVQAPSVVPNYSQNGYYSTWGYGTGQTMMPPMGVLPVITPPVNLKVQ